MSHYERNYSRVQNRLRREAKIKARFTALHKTGIATIKEGVVRMHRQDAIERVADEFGLSVATISQILSGNYYAANIEKYANPEPTINPTLFDDDTTNKNAE